MKNFFDNKVFFYEEQEGSMSKFMDALIEREGKQSELDQEEAVRHLTFLEQELDTINNLPSDKNVWDISTVDIIDYLRLERLEENVWKMRLIKGVYVLFFFYDGDAVISHPFSLNTKENLKREITKLKQNRAHHIVRNGSITINND